MFKKALPFIAGLTVAMLLTGCDKLTQENYEKLGIGSSYEEAVDVLGKPSNCKTVVNTKSCRWGDDQKHVDAQIIGESIVFISSNGLQ